MLYCHRHQRALLEKYAILRNDILILVTSSERIHLCIITILSTPSVYQILFLTICLKADAHYVMQEMNRNSSVTSALAKSEAK